jgi:hypothetical protein
MNLKIIKTNILMAAVILMFATGCSSITTNEDGGLLKVDAGNDQTVFVGDTVNFDGSCSAKGGLFQREANWDFGDGTGEDGITAIHVYTQPGDYTAELTVSVIYIVTVNVSDDIHVKVNPLPQEAFLPDKGQSAEDAAQMALKNQTAAVLPDGRVVLAGTTDAQDSSEIAVAVETAPGSRMFERSACFVQNETDSLPDSIKVLDDENVEIGAGGVGFDVFIDGGKVTPAKGEAS